MTPWGLLEEREKTVSSTLLLGMHANKEGGSMRALREHDAM